jgi:Rel/ankyrin family protein
MEEEQMEDSPPPRLLPSPNGITLVKKEERRLSSCSPVTLSPRGERTTPTLLQPRQPVLPIGVMGGAQVFMVGGQQEEMLNSQVVNLMVESSVEDLAGNSPHRSPHQMDSQDKCCSIEMVEEPEEKFRFRYKSEMQGTHGCIHGRTYSKKNKTFPTVQVHNVPVDVSSVRLRIALYTNETSIVPHHHVHKMMWKQASDTEQDFIECNVERDQGFRHSWQGLGIIHTSRKNIEQTLTSRISKLFIESKQAGENSPRTRLTDAEELKLKAEAHKLGKQVTDKLNTVVLGVEAFRVDHGIYRPLCPMVFSNPINNLKNPSTGELKICRISAFAGSVEGEEEVIILIERVKKGDIHVRFFELDQDEERVWEELAEFQEGDVHHQYAIVFKTPKYRDVDVTQDVGVFFELYRPSDGAVSDPKAFRYKPSGKTRLGKRARLEPLAIRSRPLPLAQESELSLTSSDPGLNLNNIIDDLMRNPEYLESLNEPTPYDHIQNIPNLHCSSDIVPDLLQFPRSQGAIASDSVGPLEPVAVISGQSASQELDGKVMEGLTSALLKLTTNNSPRARSEARELLLETSGCEGNNVLHTAIIKEASDSVKSILRLIEKSGEQEVLEETNKAGLNALLLAVHTGQPEVVCKLLECGANPDSRDNDGESAVHAAVREESSQMLQILLKAGANPNLPSHLGKFPLHLAVEQNLLPLVRLMVDQGVDVEAREQAAGRTALHLAVDRQLEEMVRYLVKEAMVDLGREDYGGLTALAFAESCRNQNILRLITKGVRKQNK